MNVRIKSPVVCVGGQLTLSLTESDLRGVTGLTDTQRRLIVQRGGYVGPLPEQPALSLPLVAGYARQHWPAWSREHPPHESAKTFFNKPIALLY